LIGAKGGDSCRNSMSWRPWTERSEGSGWSHAGGKRPPCSGNQHYS